MTNSLGKLADGNRVHLPRHDNARRWADERFPVYSRACVVSLVFFLPLVVGAGVTDSVSVTKITLVWWFGVIGLALWTIWALQQGARLPRMKIALPVLVLLGACAASVVFSISPSLSLLGLRERYGGFVPLISFVAVMLLIVALYQDDPEGIAGVIYAAFGASAIVSIYILFQAAGIDALTWHNPGGVITRYPFGALGNSNFAGGYLAITLPLSLYVVLTRPTIVARSIVAGLVSLQVLALWYTQTRGGFLAAVMSCIVLAILMPRSRSAARISLRRRSMAIGLGAVLLVAVVALGSATREAEGPLASGRSATLTDRLEFWTAALKVTRDNPIFGTGPDTFYASFLPYRSSAEAKYSGMSLPDEPHNIFLGRAADSGIIAFAAYISVIGLVVIGAIRKLRSSGYRNQRMLAALLAALAAYLVQGFFSIDEPFLAVMGWILIGSIVVASSPFSYRKGTRAREDNSTSGLDRDDGEGSSWRQHRGWIRGIQCVIVLLAVGLLAVGSLPLVAAAEAQGDLATAIRLQPWNAVYLIRGGDLERAAGAASHATKARERHFLSAEKYYKRALDVQPDDPGVEVGLARLYTVWAETGDARRFVDAARLWQQALALDSRDPELRGQWMTSAQGMIAAGDALVEAARKDPSRGVEAFIGAAHAYMAAMQASKARDAVVAALAIDPVNREAGRLFAALSGTSQPK